MAKTPAEIQKAYRDRKKKQEVKASQDFSAEAKVFRQPFFEYFKDDWFGSNYSLGLELAGIDPPPFEDDSGPEEHTKYEDIPEPDSWDYPFPKEGGSLARAEFMIACVNDAMIDLAGWVNSYKKREIKQRLQEIEERDLSDPEAKRAAMQEATRLNKMLDQLDKQVRITFPQWKVTG